MDKLSKVTSYFRKHEFLAVNAICAIAVVGIVLGFGLYGLMAMLFGIQGEELTQREEAEQLHTQVQEQGECSVDFKDKDFGIAVADALGIEYAQLTQEDLLEVTELTISGNPYVKRLDDVALMPALECLTVTDCAITSVRPLAKLTELRELDLSGNEIIVVSTLLKLENLEKLNLSDNPVQNMPALADLEHLSVLNLDSTSIQDLEFLEGSGVKELHISYTSLTDVELLGQCKELECLYLYGYNEMDLTPLHELENFNSIYLSQGFDRSEIDFMAGRFMLADKYSKVYLVLKNRGIDVYE